MTKWFTAIALGMLSATSAAAGEMSPGNGYSIKLGDFDGSVYYTVEPKGYRVVATLASETEPLPIRFVSTLEPGQSVTISVPRAIGQPPVDMQIAREGETLVLGDRDQAAVAIDDMAILSAVKQ